MSAASTRSMGRARRLFVHATGPLGTTPIVFLHPSGSNASAWDRHLDLLRAEHRCVALDLPGHRYSQSVRWESIASTADDVADLIVEQAGGRAHVVGLSLGGSVALALMARRPDVLDHVIVDGAAALPNPWAWLLKGAVSAISPALHSGVVIRGMAAALGLNGDEGPAFAAGMRAIPPNVFRRAFCQAQDVRITAALLDVAAPTLLVAGERDPRATRESNATLAALLPHAEARFLPRAGHAWMTTHPRLHAQMVQAWITDAPLPDDLHPLSGPAAWRGSRPAPSATAPGTVRPGRRAAESTG